VTRGVPHSASVTAPIRLVPWPLRHTAALALFDPPLLVVAVGHKVKSIALVVRTRARGFNRHGPHGVFHFFQVVSHISEPFKRIRRLFAKQD
jgi:hypothetical protein